MPVISALEKIVNSRPAWAILKQQNEGGQNDSADKGAGHHTWWLELKQKMTLARCPLLSTFIPWLLCVYVDSIQSLVHDRRAIYQGPHPQTPSLLCVSQCYTFLTRDHFMNCMPQMFMSEVLCFHFPSVWNSF